MSDIERKAAAFDWLSNKDYSFYYHVGRGDWTLKYFWGGKLNKFTEDTQLQCVEKAIKVDQEQQ